MKVFPTKAFHAKLISYAKMQNSFRVVNQYFLLDVSSDVLLHCTLKFSLSKDQNIDFSSSNLLSLYQHFHTIWYIF